MQSWISRYFLYFPSTLLKGENVFRHLDDARRFQYLPRSAIDVYQLHHLKRLVAHAYDHSPFYRKLYASRGVTPSDIRSLEDASSLPEISKKDLATNLNDISTGRHHWLLSRKTTGGSTGQAVTLLKNAGALARERAVTARSYEWAGVRIGDPQARFWGVPLSDMGKLKYRLIDFIANRQRYSAFAVDDVSRQTYYAAIVQFQPRYLYGYVSALADFADYLTRSDLLLPRSVAATITTSEVLTSQLREKLVNAFRVPVFNEYGCGEVGSIAHECERGSMHIMEDNLLVEFDVDSRENASEMIITDLFNYATPLIRYRIGDFATPGHDQCDCGRTLRTLLNVHGRAYDRIVTPDGKSHHPEKVMYIFEALKDRHNNIDQFQFVQTGMGTALIKVVKGAAYGDSMEAIISAEIRRELHESMEVRFEYVSRIEREQSGKLRVIKSQI